MGGRRRTREELLTAWLHDAEATAAALNERAEAAAAASRDAADPRLGCAPWTADAVVAVWAAQMLLVELSPSDPIPGGIRTAFARAQALLWNGQPISDPAALVDDPSLVPRPEERQQRSQRFRR